MMQYKLCPIIRNNTELKAVIRYNDDGSISSIPVNTANTDYQNFKKQINADEAQLLDADGNLMSPEQAKAYVATLP